MMARFTEHFSPAEIRIDNTVSADYTVVEIPAHTIRGLLPRLSDALARHYIDIHHVRIDQCHRNGYIRLFLCHRSRGKITSLQDQRVLHLLVGSLLKFSTFLSDVPTPDMAQQHFERFVERLADDTTQPDQLGWLLELPTLHTLATVLGNSHFLWEDFLRQTYTSHLPVLTHMEETDQRMSKYILVERLQHMLAGRTPAHTGYEALNLFKEKELFRIFVRHLRHPNLPFGAFSEELTELAEVVVGGAFHLAQHTLQRQHGIPHLAHGYSSTFAVFGLGKLGGGELGYASDLDILCVYGSPDPADAATPPVVGEYAEKLVQEISHLLASHRSETFRLDLQLRPYGKQGVLATSHTALREYYRLSGHAAPFERQALIKLRWIAGDMALGKTIETWRDCFVYRRAPCDLSAIAELRQRQRHEMVRHGTTNLKYSQGGLVDVEYIVQSLQLRYGATIPTLRTPNTLQALNELHRVGLIPDADAQHLRAAYHFLRRLIDALRMVKGRAKDVVLPAQSSNDFTQLARRLQSWEGHSVPIRLAHTITQHMQRIAYLAHKYGIDEAPSTPWTICA